jgi:hypothetical protein
MPPVQVYSYGTLSVQDDNPNLPAILAQVVSIAELWRTARSTVMTSATGKAKFVAKILASSMQGFSIQ